MTPPADRVGPHERAAPPEGPARSATGAALAQPGAGVAAPGRLRLGWLCGWTMALAAATLFVLPFAGLIGPHLAGQLWDKLGLRSPYLWQVAQLCAGLLASGLIGLVQWLFLRRAGVAGRFVLFALGAGAATGLANGLGLSGAGLVALAGAAALLASLAQRKLLGARGRLWPAAQPGAVILAGLAFTVPWPPALLLPISLGLLLAAAAIAGLPLAQ